MYFPSLKRILKDWLLINSVIVIIIIIIIIIIINEYFHRIIPQL